MFGPPRRVRDVNPRGTTSMYEHGKSDKPIVPMKLANKGGCEDSGGAGEEGRGLTKGNLFWQNRFRTLCREGVDMANPKRARNGKPRIQPREGTYVDFSDLQNALERIRDTTRVDKSRGMYIVMTRGRSPVR